MQGSGMDKPRYGGKKTMTKLKVAFCNFTKAPERKTRKKERGMLGGNRKTRDS